MRVCRKQVRLNNRVQQFYLLQEQENNFEKTYDQGRFERNHLRFVHKKSLMGISFLLSGKKISVQNALGQKSQRVRAEYMRYHLAESSRNTSPVTRDSLYIAYTLTAISINPL